jgi:predicted nucleic acid-binding protein
MITVFELYYGIEKNNLTNNTREFERVQGLKLENYER